MQSTRTSAYRRVHVVTHRLNENSNKNKMINNKSVCLPTEVRTIQAVFFFFFFPSPRTFLQSKDAEQKSWANCWLQIVASALERKKNLPLRTEKGLKQNGKVSTVGKKRKNERQLPSRVSCSKAKGHRKPSQTLHPGMWTLVQSSSSSQDAPPPPHRHDDNTMTRNEEEIKRQRIKIAEAKGAVKEKK